MNPSLLIRIFFSIIVLAGFLYAYIHKQNEITTLRLKVPALAKELDEVEQENSRLQFEIDQFENPVHLMELARKPEFRHLKHPLVKDIIEIQVCPK
jgi:cell division protein FtsL